MEPNIVKEIINAQGQTVSKIEPKEIGTVVSTENATILKQYMRSVVTEGYCTKC